MSALPNEDEAYEAFQVYAKAKQRVEQTMDFADAMAAGRAWRTFINTFMPPDRQVQVDANVIPFPAREQSIKRLRQWQESER
jgi:hypothetical protein